MFKYTICIIFYICLICLICITNHERSVQCLTCVNIFIAYYSCHFITMLNTITNICTPRAYKERAIRHHRHTATNGESSNFNSIIYDAFVSLLSLMH